MLNTDSLPAVRLTTCPRCGTAGLVAVAVKTPKTRSGYRTAYVYGDALGPKTSTTSGDLRRVRPSGGRTFEAVPHIPQEALWATSEAVFLWTSHECRGGQ